MERAKLLWLDLTIATHYSEISQNILEYFDVTHITSTENIDKDPRIGSGIALCFEFDYPGQAGLSALGETKHRYPQIPVLMLTAQHSEQLAVWAYRNGVLDYLVKPIPSEDLRRCRDLILAIDAPAEHQPARRMIDCKSDSSSDVPARQWSRNDRLSPALNFVKIKFRDKIRNSDVARACNMSAYHFSHEFTQAFELTFQEFVLRYRILEACKELRYPNISVSHVAYSVGFNDPSYFARVFRRFIKLSPSEYCERVKSEEHAREISHIIRQLEMPDIHATTLDGSERTKRHSRHDIRLQAAR
jgi:AraC-like DNA-binding protein